MTTEPRIDTFYAKRGGQFSLPIELVMDGDTNFDWSTVSARCQIRDASRTLIIEPNCSISGSSGGRAQLLIPFLGSQTAVMPEETFGDVLLERASPVFGPEYSPTFRIVLETPQTNPPTP
ncbi:MAG: hypothetical protein IT581_14070 [Verrucomicrobiales bacterium]|nr:hypothetical protein [Verrucomicrobiales bacterium]